MRRLTTALRMALIALAVGACAQTTGAPGEERAGTDLAAAFAGEAGKEDLARSTRLVDDIALGSEVDGRFDGRTRVYGYVFEAKRGAIVTIALDATAGDDAFGLEEGAHLDTLMALYGPFEDVRAPGALLVESEDGAQSLAAPAIRYPVEADGRYLIAFSTWDDPGTGRYRVDLGCEGTDFQCQRPDWSAPCEAGTLYLQGGRVEGDQTWRTCEIVLLENTEVSADTTLTIAPGVVVRANYLGSTAFGDVGLHVRGTLQAAGTADHPIAFTSLTPSGWRGITLYGPSNHVSHAFVENASVGIALTPGASAEITDVVLEGARIRDRRSEAGIFADADVEATFIRALVKGFDVGLSLADAQTLIVEDSVIRDNGVGLRVNGTSPLTACPTQPTSAPRVTAWRDPIVRHSDIVDNQNQGILVHGSNVLLQVEDSNIHRNGIGVSVEGSNLNPESYLRHNNIHDNRVRQVVSLHRAGTVDLSQNYWVHISDPALSRSWQMGCGGPMTFTGFSPESFAGAGPRLEVLIEPVAQATWQAQQRTVEE